MISSVIGKDADISFSFRYISNGNLPDKESWVTIASSSF